MNTRLIRKYNESNFSPHPITIELSEALNQAGYDASLWDIEWAWREYSETMATGFLICDDFDYAVQILLNYLEPENQEPCATP